MDRRAQRIADKVQQQSGWRPRNVRKSGWDDEEDNFMSAPKMNYVRRRRMQRSNDDFDDMPRRRSRNDDFDDMPRRRSRYDFDDSPPRRSRMDSNSGGWRAGGLRNIRGE